MVSKNPKLAKSMKFESFLQKNINKKGVVGETNCNPASKNEDPYIYKVNSSILLMEEIFEKRRTQDMKRPPIKAQVMRGLQNCVATPQFLLQLRKQQKKDENLILKEFLNIDNQTIKAGFELPEERQ